ncbi:MAG: hypothetical protein EPN21_16955 [Methylococcaceae bacterium]|nr:MAG: hypothetical protein EPN21_16955 [Methylococcaceae bacterium]
MIDRVTGDGGLVSNSGATYDPGLMLIGHAQAGGTVTVFDGKNSLGTATAGAAGRWIFLTHDLDDGKHVFTAQATDADGNASEAGDRYTVAIVTQPLGPPTPPTIESVMDDVEPLAGVVGKRGATNDSHLVLSGKAEPNGRVELFDGDLGLGKALTDARGVWYFGVPAVKDGDHVFKATTTDASGNTSVLGSGYPVTLDTQPPSAPSIDAVTDDAGSVQGKVARQGRSDDALLVLSGKAEAGVTVDVFDGADRLGSALTDPAGQWRYATGALRNGVTYAFKAKAMDEAGNTAASDSYPVTIDTAWRRV